MAYKNMDTMTLAESMREHPWQDYEWMSFHSGGKVHRRLDQGTNRSRCGLEAPSTGGHNYYERYTDFSPRAVCKRCLPVEPSTFTLNVLAGTPGF